MPRIKMATQACAACKMNRKKCTKKCVFAPHFPSRDPHKFAVVHSVFGTSHVFKMIQGVPGELRADVVNSLVYEASARVRDPIHGCQGIVNQLQTRIAELESQLAATQAELQRLPTKDDKTESQLIMGDQNLYPTNSMSPKHSKYSMTENDDPFYLWEPLWQV